MRSLLVPCASSHATNWADGLDPGCPSSAITRQSQMPSFATSMSSTKPLQSSSMPSQTLSSSATATQVPAVPSSSPTSNEGPSSAVLAVVSAVVLAPASLVPVTGVSLLPVPSTSSLVADSVAP